MLPDVLAPHRNDLVEQICCVLSERSRRISTSIYSLNEYIFHFCYEYLRFCFKKTSNLPWDSRNSLLFWKEDYFPVSETCTNCKQPFPNLSGGLTWAWSKENHGQCQCKNATDWKLGWDEALLLFLSRRNSKCPGALWATGRHWVGCRPRAQAAGSAHLQLAWLVPGLLFLSGKTGDEGIGDFFRAWWRPGGQSVVGFSVLVSLLSIRKWWRRFWVGFEVLETFSKSWSPLPIIFLKCEAVVKAGGDQRDASQNAAPHQM